jgi:hypothetical protein
MEDLKVNDPEEKEQVLPVKKESKKTTKKSVKKVVKKCNVPNILINSYDAWARHIYLMIKEANSDLILKEQVIDAYNAFIKILDKHKDSIRYAIIPYRRLEKYKIGVKLTDDPLEPFTGSICILDRRFYNPSPRGLIQLPISTDYLNDDGRVIMNEIIEVYRVLYDLIKDIVVPYMDQQYNTLYYKNKHQLLRSKMENYTNQLKSLSERYEREVLRLSKMITTVCKEIEELENTK